MLQQLDKPMKIVEMNKLEAVRYLTLYLGKPSNKSWEEHMDEFYNQKRKYIGDEAALQALKRNIAFALMLRYKEKIKIPEPYQGVLFGAEKWSQYNDADWISLFQEVLKQDEKIKRWRSESLSLGVIYPIEYCPITRQAYNWLFEKAQDTGAITSLNKTDMIDKFQKLVLAYGGNVVCHIFKNESLMNKEVISWETNYFFERLIFQVYKIDEILKIKKQELAKANPKLVKQIRQD